MDVRTWKTLYLSELVCILILVGCVFSVAWVLDFEIRKLKTRIQVLESKVASMELPQSRPPIVQYLIPKC